MKAGSKCSKKRCKSITITFSFFLKWTYYIYLHLFPITSFLSVSNSTSKRSKMQKEFLKNLANYCKKLRKIQVYSDFKWQIF